MNQTNGITAEQFREAFLASYTKVRSCFSDRARWSEVFRAWNTLMLWQPTATYHPPEEIELSILGETAKRLGVSYQNGEPLRIDAVFSAQRNDWFPMLVAVEHENDWRGFESEVRKLLSVRCPLKVGITYTGESPKGEQYRARIARIIEEDFAEISNLAEEGPQTEYLFLIGAESDDKEISCWYSLGFQARTGPDPRGFVPIGEMLTSTI